LFGYPKILFLDQAGRQINFHVRHHGSQMVTSKRPRLVVLRPGRTAFVSVDKWRCDSGDEMPLILARKLEVVVTGHDGPRRVVLRMPRNYTVCDAGSEFPIQVSPFEPTWRAASGH
jgi:hypothetical protein